MSNDQQLTLSSVGLDATGRYKCEVLTESPHFKTLVKSSVMQVVGEYILEASKFSWLLYSNGKKQVLNNLVFLSSYFDVYKLLFKDCTLSGNMNFFVECMRDNQ